MLETEAENIMRVNRPTKARAVVCDLGNTEVWRQIAVNLAAELDVGFVVYNAAYSPVGLFTSYPLEMHEHTVKVNIQSPLITIGTFVGNMKTKGRGAIVLMSSVDGEGCSPYVANYAGTKAWTTTFAEGLWYELSPDGIDVLGVIAGLTATSSIDRVIDPAKREALKAFESTPREVVMESLRALGRGHPTVITGLGSRLVAWTRWFLPRRIGCNMFSMLHDIVREESELLNVANRMMKPGEK